MRSHALLINVTRGRIVDEQALLTALAEGQIGGAGLDVVPQEPLPAGSPAVADGQCADYAAYGRGIAQPR